jgi:hypothetical protein
MSDLRLSPATKALLAVAKRDTPNAAARAKMWANVNGTIGAVGATGGASSLGSAAAAGAARTAGGAGVAAGLGGGAAAMKMLAVGTLLGGIVSVGVAATFLRVSPVPEGPPPGTSALAVPAAHGPQRVSRNVLAAPAPAANPGAVVSADASGDRSSRPSTAEATASARAPAQTVRQRRARRAPLDESAALSYEAELIGDARAALRRDDSVTALRLAREARALPARQLVPEELAVEAQALRALGRNNEANDLAEQLRSQYPESALAR